MTEHRHGSIRINDIDGDAGAAPDAEFCRVEQVTLNGEPQRTNENCAGEIVSDLTTVDEVNPSLQFQVKDHGQIIVLNSAECGIGVHDVELYLREVEDSGKKPKAKDSANHDYFEFYHALFYWTRMTLEPRQSSFDCVLDVTFDPGEANPTPFALQEDVVYPTIAGGHDVFALSKALLNTTELSGVRRVTVENEYQFDNDVDQSRQTEYREARAINDAITRIRVQLSERINWVPTTGIPHLGLTLDGINGLEFYARKKGYATTAAEHVLWRAESGTAYPVNLTGSGSNLATDEFIVDVLKTDYLPDGVTLKGDPAAAGNGKHLVGLPGQTIP